MLWLPLKTMAFGEKRHKMAKNAEKRAKTPFGVIYMSADADFGSDGEPVSNPPIRINYNFVKSCNT